MNELLEISNAVSCLLMLCYILTIAIIMPGHGYWGSRIVIWVLAVSLGLQTVSPWSDWVPTVVWHGALLNSALAVALLVCHKEVMCFIRAKFAPNKVAHPVRRCSDIQELGAMDTHRIRGAGK